MFEDCRLRLCTQRREDYELITLFIYQDQNMLIQKKYVHLANEAMFVPKTLNNTSAEEWGSRNRTKMIVCCFFFHERKTNALASQLESSDISVPWYWCNGYLQQWIIHSAIKWGTFWHKRSSASDNLSLQLKM